MLPDEILMTDYRAGATLMHERHEYPRVAARISRLIMHTRLHYRAYAISARDVDDYRNSRTIRNKRELRRGDKTDDESRDSPFRANATRSFAASFPPRTPRLALPVFLSLSSYVSRKYIGPHGRPITPERQGQLLRVISRAFKQKETAGNNTDALIDRHQTE